MPSRLAVRRDRVNLALVVLAWDKPVRAAAICTTHDGDNVTTPDGPLALNTEQLRPNVEDKVVAFVAERPRYTRTVLHRLECNRLLGECALLIRRQHRQQRTCAGGRRSPQNRRVRLGRGCFERLVRDVVPQVLEAVELARLGGEDVHDDVDVVADDPRRLLLALDRARQKVVLVLQPAVHLVPDPLCLARVATRRHDEVVGVGADGLHIEDDDVAAELVLDDCRDPACLFERAQAVEV